MAETIAAMKTTFQKVTQGFTASPPRAVILTGWHSRMMFQALWAGLRLRLPVLDQYALVAAGTVCRYIQSARISSSVI